MSLINSILEKITGLDLDGSDSKETVVERPCSNCPSDCAIAGDACTVCEPYKKKLIDWVYHVDHLEDFLAQYEVVSAAQVTSGGTTHCPRCGANSTDPYICEYCGSQLAEKPASSGKIQVTAASEIPNPITEAQDVIFDRYNAVIKQYSQANTSSSSSGGLLSSLFSELLGTSSNTDDDESALGAKMSEAEIKEAAELYGVTTGTYLTGLDNGKYLTLSAKKEADALGKSASSYTPAAAGLAGMAGIGMLAGGLMGGSGNRKRWDTIPQRPVQQPTRRDEPQRPVKQPEPQKPQQSMWDNSAKKPVQQTTKREEPAKKPAQQTVKWEDPVKKPAQQSSIFGDPGKKPTQQTNKREEPVKKPAQQASIWGNSSSKPAEPSRSSSSQQKPAQPTSRPSQSASRRDEPKQTPSSSRSQNSGSDRWKERDPGKRNR